MKGQLVGWPEFGVKGREMDAARAAGVSCHVIVSSLVHGQEPDRVTRRRESLKASAAVTSVGRWWGGLLRAAAVERRGGGGRAGWAVRGSIGSLGQWPVPGFKASRTCCVPRASAVLAEAPVSRIGSSTARVFAGPSPFRALPTFSRSAGLVGECRRVGVRVRGFYPLTLQS